jgi:seryl-tRNA synthetase
MHDIRYIRENENEFDELLARRGIRQAPFELVDLLYQAGMHDNPDAESLTPEAATGFTLSGLVLRIDELRRAAIESTEFIQRDQRVTAQLAGEARKKGDAAEFERFQRSAIGLKAALEPARKRAEAYDNALKQALLRIPNLPADDVPEGPDETANVEIRRWGSPRNFPFTPLEHFEIPAAKPGLDFEAAGRLSGSRFVVMKGAMVRLHRALAQLMLDTHVESHGLTEVWTPVLVRDEAMLGTGQLPKFAEESYQTTNGWWLIPTSEVTLTNLVSGQILDEAALPIRMTALTQCFRSEAGSAGKDTAGMLRQHQFEKVEMVSVTRPEDSRPELDRMTACAQNILEALALPYRTVVLSTGDMGFGARRTHDIEVWLPGQDTYREISSCSVCGDFQARRMNARFRRGEGARPEFVHTLNGSGLAVGRTLIAVLENGQEEDGSVTIPAALHPYLGGRSRITADGTLA